MFVPGLSFGVPDFPDLTFRECQRNSWHLDDHPDIHVEVDQDGTSHITGEHQLVMLKRNVPLLLLLEDRPSGR